MRSTLAVPCSAASTWRSASNAWQVRLISRLHLGIGKQSAPSSAHPCSPPGIGNPLANVCVQLGRCASDCRVLLSGPG
jgi:hypothetical protein